MPPPLSATGEERLTQSMPSQGTKIYYLTIYYLTIYLVIEQFSNLVKERAATPPLPLEGEVPEGQRGNSHLLFIHLLFYH